MAPQAAAKTFHILLERLNEEGLNLAKIEVVSNRLVKGPEWGNMHDQVGPFGQSSVSGMSSCSGWPIFAHASQVETMLIISFAAASCIALADAPSSSTWAVLPQYNEDEQLYKDIGCIYAKDSSWLEHKLQKSLARHKLKYCRLVCIFNCCLADREPAA